MKDTEKYKKHYNKESFFVKLKKRARKIGMKAAYSLLLMYNAYTRKDTPQWAKNIILGAIGYFIAPIDALPDLTPFLGYTDDLGILSFGLVTIAGYINDDVKINARKQLHNYFGSIDLDEIQEVDAKL